MILHASADDGGKLIGFAGSHGRFDLLGPQHLWANRQANRQDGRQDGNGPIFFSEYIAPGHLYASRRLGFPVHFKRRSLVPARFLKFILVPLAALSAQLDAQAPAFSDPGPLSSDTGHALIEWDASGRVTLEMGRGPDLADARAIYSGTNHAFFLSGLADGTYRLRLRGGDGSISEPLRLDVSHQSLNRALFLSLVGAIVALSILVVIVRGARDE